MRHWLAQHWDIVVGSILAFFIVALDGCIILATLAIILIVLSRWR